MSIIEPELYDISSSIITPTKYNYSIPENLEIINMDDALTQVGQDHSFLIEVLNDFEQELIDADLTIQHSIPIWDFQTIAKAAHRVKGSAAYLYCEQIQHVALQLQLVAHVDGSMTNEERMERVKELYDFFQKAMDKFIENVMHT